MDVFISYSSKEYEEASTVSDILRKNGITTWIAPGSIPGGSNYTKEIPHAIRECKVFLLILSENAQNSVWVSAEVETAFKNGKLILPFVIDTCPLKDEFDFLLSRSQRIEAYEKKSEALERLVKRIKALIGSEGDDVIVEKKEIPTKQSVNKVLPNGIRVYAGGYYWNDQKNSSAYYLKSETMYIWVQMLFDNPSNVTSTKLNWEIYKENGTSFSGPRESLIELAPGNDSVHSGWGWKSKGNWEIGRYYIIATLDDSKPFRVEFEIAGGNYSNDNIKIKMLKLFNAGDSVTDSEHYEDSRRFSRDTLKRVYFNFHFKPIGRTCYTTINYKIIKPNGDVMANMSTPINLKPNSDRCWTGYGWADAGNWKPGVYSYEASLGNSKVFRGEFTVE